MGADKRGKRSHKNLDVGWGRLSDQIGQKLPILPTTGIVYKYDKRDAPKIIADAKNLRQPLYGSSAPPDLFRNDQLTIRSNRENWFDLQLAPKERCRG